MLTQLLYHSRLSEGISQSELVRIQVSAIKYNSERGITSALLTQGKDLYHLLEGDGLALSKLCYLLRRDPRHTDFTVLTRRPIMFRKLEGWSFCLLDSQTPMMRRIYKQFNQSEVNPSQIDLAIKIIKVAAKRKRSKVMSAAPHQIAVTPKRSSPALEHATARLTKLFVQNAPTISQIEVGELS